MDASFLPSPERVVFLAWTPCGEAGFVRSASRQVTRALASPNETECTHGRVKKVLSWLLRKLRPSIKQDSSSVTPTFCNISTPRSNLSSSIQKNIQLIDAIISTLCGLTRWNHEHETHCWREMLRQWSDSPVLEYRRSSSSTFYFWSWRDGW